MKHTLLTPTLALVGATLLPCAVHAQTMDNNGMMTTGMMQKSMMTSDADRQFLTETAEGSAYDQATAELAVQKAQSKSVQRYALRLMDDHTRLNKMLFMQMNMRGVVAMPMLSDDDKTKLDNLKNNSAGMDFDMAYIKEAMEINAEDIRKGNEAINASTDDSFRRLMREYVKTEQKHLDSASAIMTVLQRQMNTMNPGMMNSGMMNPGMMNNNMAPTTTAPMTTAPITTAPMTTAPMDNTTMAPTTTAPMTTTPMMQ